MKRKGFVSIGIDRSSVQKPLSTFFEEKDKEKEENKVEEDRVEEKGEIEHEEIFDKIIEKRSRIETDYYEKSRIDICAKMLKERFNVDIDIMPVRYGSKPPIDQKIYGYYMLISVRGKGYDIIADFIRNECNLKVY